MKVGPIEAGASRSARGLTWRRLGAWAVSALACGGLTATLVQGPMVSAKAHPSALGIGLEGFKPNWWAPLLPGTNCYTLSGGVGGGMYSYMPLLWVNGNDQINYSMSLASSINVSRNDSAFTIHLDPKWHWSNGTPVTSSDVVYSWDLMKAASAPKSPLPYCYAGTGEVPSGWKSVTADGPYTVVIRTTKPVNPVWFEHNGIAQINPLPKAVWDKYPNLTKELSWIVKVAPTPSNPVYKVIDGPYNISKIALNQYYEFTWNPKFDGHKPAIHKVIYYYEASDAAEFAALKTGQIQIGNLPSSLWSDRSQLTGFRILPAPQAAFYFIALNMSPKSPGIGDLFTKLYVRQALQYGINQPQIAKFIFHGTAQSTVGPVPTASGFFDHALKDPYPYNPVKGKALLEAHGWKMVHGVMTKGGKKLAFQVILTPGVAANTNEILAIQQAWATEGIKATIREMSAGTAAEIVGSSQALSKWNTATAQLWIYVPDYYPTGGDLFAPGAGFNLGQYSNPEMTRLIHETYLAGTPSQVKARFDAYQVFAAKQLPVLYIPTAENINVVSDQVGGWVKNYNLIISDPPIWDLYWK